MRLFHLEEKKARIFSPRKMWRYNFVSFAIYRAPAHSRYGREYKCPRGFTPSNGARSRKVPEMIGMKVSLRIYLGLVELAGLGY